MKKFFLSTIGALLMTLAAVGTASACAAFMYQPELPRE